MRLWRLQCGQTTEALRGQAEKQQRYLQLVAQGVNNSEACRLVGINRKTGNRWRYGRPVRNSAGALVIYPPVKMTPGLNGRILMASNVRIGKRRQTVVCRPRRRRLDDPSVSGPPRRR